MQLRADDTFGLPKKKIVLNSNQDLNSDSQNNLSVTIAHLPLNTITLLFIFFSC
jgi:hypothetical protein